MSSRTRNLIFLLAALSVIAAVCAVIAVREKPGEDEDVPKKIALYDYTLDSIASFDWTYNGETISVVNLPDSKLWGFVDYPEIKASTSEIVGILNKVRSVSALSTIEQGDELNAYGLEEPPLSFTITLKDGTKTNLRAGLASAAAGGYYGMVDDDPTIYIISSEIVSAFDLAFIDLIAQDAVQIYEDKELMSVSMAGATVSYARTGKADDKETWVIVKGDGTTLPVDTDMAYVLIDKVSHIAWERAVAFRPTEAELEGYGLLPPAMTVRLICSYTEEGGAKTSQDITVNIGYVDKESGSTYMTLPGSELVYLVDSQVSNDLASFFYSYVQ